MECKQCGINHNGSYGSGIFCSKECRYKWLAKLGSQKGANTTIEKYKKIRLERIKKILANEEPPSILKGNLKDYLFEFGYKQRKCEICNLELWCDKPIPLQLHHIDGNHSNNNLDNLQILCHNCHAQTDTYGYKNINKKKE